MANSVASHMAFRIVCAQCSQSCYKWLERCLRYRNKPCDMMLRRCAPLLRRQRISSWTRMTGRQETYSAVKEGWSRMKKASDSTPFRSHMHKSILHSAQTRADIQLRHESRLRLLWSPLQILEAIDRSIIQNDQLPSKDALCSQAVNPLTVKNPSVCIRKDDEMLFAEKSPDDTSLRCRQQPITKHVRFALNLESAKVKSMPASLSALFNVNETATAEKAIATTIGAGVACPDFQKMEMDTEEWVLIVDELYMKNQSLRQTLEELHCAELDGDYKNMTTTRLRNQDVPANLDHPINMSQLASFIVQSALLIVTAWQAEVKHLIVSLWTAHDMVSASCRPN